MKMNDYSRLNDYSKSTFSKKQIEYKEMIIK